MHSLLFFFVIILCSINILMLCSRRTVQAENTHTPSGRTTAQHTHECVISWTHNLRFIHTSARTHTHHTHTHIRFSCQSCLHTQTYWHKQASWATMRRAQTLLHGITTQIYTSQIHRKVVMSFCCLESNNHFKPT